MLTFLSFSATFNFKMTDNLSSANKLLILSVKKSLNSYIYSFFSYIRCVSVRDIQGGLVNIDMCTVRNIHGG